jgi:hypothetical protein
MLWDGFCDCCHVFRPDDCKSLGQWRFCQTCRDEYFPLNAYKKNEVVEILKKVHEKIENERV